MIIITIKTDNAAFDNTDDPCTRQNEIARILRELADEFENGGEPSALRDINGNTVGRVIDYDN